MEASTTDASAREALTTQALTAGGVGDGARDQRGVPAGALAGGLAGALAAVELLPDDGVMLELLFPLLAPTPFPGAIVPGELTPGVVLGAGWVGAACEPEDCARGFPAFGAGFGPGVGPVFGPASARLIGPPPLGLVPLGLVPFGLVALDAELLDVELL
jgi:hypothetical protein